MHIPEHIINELMMYVSHPVADLFKQEYEIELFTRNHFDEFNDFYRYSFYNIWKRNKLFKPEHKLTLKTLIGMQEIIKKMIS